MKTRIRLAALSVFIALVALPKSAYPGFAEGNGGDHVRAMFIQMGQTVIEYLRETAPGSDLLARNSLSLAELESALTIERISAVDGTLKDNGGAEVDALGEPGKVTLSKSRWIEHFEKDSDVYYLVFHEMLRSVARNDDNYVLSSALNPFPANRKIATRIGSKTPLIAEDLLEKAIRIDDIAVSGTGCPSKLEGTVTTFDSERNILDITLKRFQLRTEGEKKLDRKNCSIVIPVATPKNKRIVVSQIDLASKIDLPKGSSASYRVESFLAGSSGTATTRVLDATSEAQQGRVLVRRNEILRSGCGKSDNLRINASAFVKNVAPGAATLNADRVAVYLRAEPCN